MDFVAKFWHCECISEHSEKAFTNKYQRWCKKPGCNFSTAKAHSIYAAVCEPIGCMPKCNTTKLLVDQAVAQLRATSAVFAALKNEMQTLASQLPDYSVVIGMFGVGDTLGPQLMAEIGDVRRFHHKQSFSSFCRCGCTSLSVWHFWTPSQILCKPLRRCKIEI